MKAAPIIPSFPGVKPFVRMAITELNQRRLKALGLILGLTTWAMIATAYPDWLISLQKTSEVISNHADTDNLQQLLARQEFKEVSLDLSDTGQRQISGWVNNTHDLTLLRNALRHRTIRLSVVTVDEQLRFAQEFLGGSGRQVQVQYQGHGRFYVRASTHDEAAFKSRLLQWQAMAPAVMETQLEHTAAAAVVTQSAAPVKHGAPARDLIPGVDGICEYGSARYLTVGQHYIFEGAQLKNGLVIRSIAEPSRAPDLIAARTPLAVRTKVLMP